MASKNEQKIQEIVDAMASKGIIASGGGITITGNQIASTIRSIPKHSSLDVTNGTQTLTLKAKRGFFPGTVNYSIAKYTGVITVTPSKTNTILPTGDRYNGSNITVKGDVNLIPANIRNGVAIFGVTGTFVDAANYISGVVNMKQGDALYYTDYSSGYGRLITTTANSGPLSSPIRVRQESFVVLMCNRNAGIPVTNGVTNVFTGQLQNYYTWNTVCIYHAYNNGFTIDSQ